MKFCRVVLVALAAAASVAGVAQTDSLFKPMTQRMAINQKLGAQVPLDVPFKDEQGRSVTLGSVIQGRPVVLVPIFYQCQTGCALITDGLLQTLLRASHPTGLIGLMDKSRERHPLQLGKDLDVVMLSINPKETPALAADKKNLIMKALGDPDGDAHWTLLTGTLENIHKVTDAIGFVFYYNPYTNVIDHPTGSVVLTPNGKISAYTIGNDFPNKLLEGDLSLASKGGVADKPADQTFMFGCIMLDPATGKIRFIVENIVRVAGVLTMLILGLYIYRSIRNEKNRNLPTGGHLTGV